MLDCHTSRKAVTFVAANEVDLRAQKSLDACGEWLLDATAQDLVEQAELRLRKRRAAPCLAAFALFLYTLLVKNELRAGKLT